MKMKKYLVNYRVKHDSKYNPYHEHTSIYETEGMMTQKDVEAFEEAMTKKYGITTKMTSFFKLEYSAPTLGDYIEALPNLTFKNNHKLETTDDDWAYIPTLYKFEGTWVIDWIDAEENDSIKVIKGTTPTEAAKNAYAWCVEKGFIKNAKI